MPNTKKTTAATTTIRRSVERRNAEKASAGRTAAHEVAVLNAQNFEMLAQIAKLLPSCGPDATWADAGDAAYANEKLGAILATLNGTAK
jgi:hypothetical protein